jgi:predicted signal transduction protein with EAL and GGDEF domain
LAIGYEAGDRLVQALGARLALDLPDAIVVGRTGGDEFTVAVPGGDALGLAARVRHSLEAPLDRGDGDVMTIDVRCGVAAMGTGGDARQLFRHADAVLQLARRGTDAVLAWDEDAARARQHQLALTARLRRALDHRAFSVDYQPIVDARTGVLDHVEALARWSHDGSERVGPGVFVPVLERLGRIGQLTAHIVEQALDEAAVGYGLAVSVNVSPLDVMRGDLVGLIGNLLAARSLDPGRLTLEVTESAALEAGTASLHELATLGVVTLGHALEMQVVAEGVEDEDNLNAVRALDCDLVQGYHLARPMDGAALANWLAARTTGA